MHWKGGLAPQHALKRGVGFPACTGKGGWLPSMNWEGGLASQHALGRGLASQYALERGVGFPACTGIRKSGWYASYWNAFLLNLRVEPIFTDVHFLQSM